MSKEKLYGKTLNELVAISRFVGLPGFAARQMSDWLYRKEIASIGEMTNLPKRAREALSNDFETGICPPVNVKTGNDGTKKYLFRVLTDKYIETAYIPDEERATVCLSTQSGCKMGCIFCMTGQQGFQGNLSANEILNQYRSIPEFGSITNIVFMGMGEPLDNLSEVLKCLEILTGGWGYGLSPTRVTVSTAGLINGIRELLEKTRCNLAVSLNSPFGPERELLMPVQKTNPASDVLDIIRNFDLNRQRRVSFEYILFKGINDTPRHVKELARVLNGIRCRINLIKFHQVQGAPYQSPGAEDIQEFRKALNNKGILTTVRVSRGEDIGAACGLLSTLEQNKGRQDE